MENICLKNKYGYCKFGAGCNSRHVKEECENKECKKWNCEKRHPKDCWWYNRFQKCQFSNCAYKHKDKYEAKQLMEISKKIRVCEEQIIEKEKEIEAQEKRILQLESEIKTKELEEKVVILEKFVLSLEEKVELLEQDRKREPETGYVYPSRLESEKIGHMSYHTMAPLLKRDSFEAKCDQCDYTGRNLARLRTHRVVHHLKFCLECDPSQTNRMTEAEFDKHNNLVHESQDKEFTGDEVEKLTEEEVNAVDFGPDTPRRKSLRKNKARTIYY